MHSREWHGKSGTVEHRVWRDMKARTKPGYRGPESHNYAGRGIATCARWRGSFLAFLEDVGPRPSPAHSLDRVDNDKGYLCGKCPECIEAGGTRCNCRWATKLEQSKNTRRNVFYEYRGRHQTLADWSRELGITLGCLRRRLERGATVEDAFNAKLKITRPRKVFSQEEIQGIRESSAAGDSIKVIAARQHLSCSTVVDILHGFRDSG